jgi:predicted amidohydrolase
MKSLTVGVCQMQSTEDVDANLAQVESLLASFRTPVDVAVFPENCLFLRIDKNSPLQKFEITDPIFRRLTAISEKSRWPLLLGSVPLLEGSKTYNAMIWIQSGQAPQVVFRKMHLFDVDVPGEKPQRESAVFAAGTRPETLQMGGFQWGLSICYDVRFADLYSVYAQLGCEVLFVPSAFLVTTGLAHWHVLLRARAIESQAFVIAPAQAGLHSGPATTTRQTFGHSLIVDPWGEIVAESHVAGPDVLVYKLDRERVDKVRAAIPMVRD